MGIIYALSLHALAVLHGIGASLVAFAVLHLAGLAVLPARWEKQFGRGGHPAAIGAALYVLTSWYGIQSGVRLTLLVAGFGLAALIAVACRASRVVRHVRAGLLTRSTLEWLGLFAGLYVLAYLFTLPPVSREHLPLAWRGNTDLLQYLVYARHLQHLGPSPIADVSAHSYVYYQTPAAFSLLGGFSVLFGLEPIRAAMPLQFALIALAGVVAGRISRAIFSATPLVSALVAGVMISGPFFRIIVGDYYLSTLLTMPVFLQLLMTTVTESGESRGGIGLGFVFFAHYVVLFFVYPFLFLTALGFQALAIALVALTSLWSRLALPRFVASQDPPPGPSQLLGRLRPAAIAAVAALGGVAALAACAPAHLAWVVRMVGTLSRPGIAGEPRDLISPLGLLGVPAAFADLPAKSAAARAWGIAGLGAIGLCLLASFLPLAAQRTKPNERVFLGLAAFGFLGYAAYFTLVGPSYQQWKFASYTVMPLAFLGILAVFRFVGAWLAGRNRGESLAGRWAAPVFAGVAGALLIGGNLAVHAASDRPLDRFPGALERLAAVNRLPSFRDLAVQAPNPRMALLVAYFVPTKRLHVSSPWFSPFEPVSFERVSRAQPLLVLDYACEGVGHDETMSVAEVGCVLFAPPSVVADTVYPFSRSYLFVEHEGLGVREGWGRWNAAPSVRLRLTADQRRIRLDPDAAYLNLLLQPCLVGGLKGQRLRLSWGEGRRAETLLGGEGWISLPLRSSDWTGDWVATQTVSVELPDIVPPHWVDGQYLESRPLAVGFEQLSITAVPRGRSIAPLQ